MPKLYLCAFESSGGLSISRHPVLTGGERLRHFVEAFCGFTTSDEAGSQSTGAPIPGVSCGQGVHNQM